MSTFWLKNFVGLKQSDYELLRVPHPRLEFTIHVTLRSMQAGTIIGSAIGPIMAMYNGCRLIERNGDMTGLKHAVKEGGSAGAIIGTVLGPILTYLALRDIGSVRLYDKCYRRRFNSEELAKDRICVLGAGIGLLSSGTLGFVVGVDLAHLTARMFNLVFSK